MEVTKLKLGHFQLMIISRKWKRGKHIFPSFQGLLCSELLKEPVIVLITHLFVTVETGQHVKRPTRDPAVSVTPLSVITAEKLIQMGKHEINKHDDSVRLIFMLN